MGVTSILNWVIAISLIGMVFGYFVLVLSTQRHNPIAWIGLTAMGLVVIGRPPLRRTDEMYSMPALRSRVRRTVLRRRRRGSRRDRRR